MKMLQPESKNYYSLHCYREREKPFFLLFIALLQHLSLLLHSLFHIYQHSFIGIHPMGEGKIIAYLCLILQCSALRAKPFHLHSLTVWLPDKNTERGRKGAERASLPVLLCRVLQGSAVWHDSLQEGSIYHLSALTSPALHSSERVIKVEKWRRTGRTIKNNKSCA